LFGQIGLKPPQDFEALRTVAKALTTGYVSGFGLRGGAGGFDHWGPLVLGGGASFEKGGMITDQALGANRWFVDLAVKDKVVPASAAPDSADGARAMALLEQTIASING
jgi:multiple sugar transport system substrate-binding protein